MNGDEAINTVQHLHRGDGVMGSIAANDCLAEHVFFETTMTCSAVAEQVQVIQASTLLRLL